MTEQELQKFESGYNEGIIYAVQVTASEIIRIINTHRSWMLEPHRVAAEAHIKMAAKRILQKRGLMPYEYDVITGKADNMNLDFNMKIK